MKQLNKGRPAFFDHYHERTKRTLGRDGGGGGPRPMYALSKL